MPHLAAGSCARGASCLLPSASDAAADLMEADPAPRDLLVVKGFTGRAFAGARHVTQDFAGAVISLAWSPGGEELASVEMHHALLLRVCLSHG